jgi:general secretion pathway protein H
LQAGFTLIELLVVLALVALVSAGAGFAMRDGAQDQLQREATRLAALLEAARAQSQLSGVAVRWVPTAQGFRFEPDLRDAQSQAEAPLTHWLVPDTQAELAQGSSLLLGPDPLIPPQSLVLRLRDQPGVQVRLGTDGVRPFALQADAS